MRKKILRVIQFISAWRRFVSFKSKQAAINYQLLLEEAIYRYLQAGPSKYLGCQHKQRSSNSLHKLIFFRSARWRRCS